MTPENPNETEAVTRIIKMYSGEFGMEAVAHVVGDIYTGNFDCSGISHYIDEFEVTTTTGTSEEPFLYTPNTTFTEIISNFTSDRRNDWFGRMFDLEIETDRGYDASSSLRAEGEEVDLLGADSDPGAPGSAERWFRDLRGDQ